MRSKHQQTDVDVSKIMWVALLGIAFFIVMFLGLWAEFSSLKSYIESKTPRMAEENLIAKRKGPPQPLLEANPFLKKKTYKEEKELLESYEWLDRENGIVRVPIKQAIEILLYDH